MRIIVYSKPRKSNGLKHMFETLKEGVDLQYGFAVVGVISTGVAFVAAVGMAVAVIL